MGYSSEQLRKLAQSDSQKFIKIIGNLSADIHTLTMGAEILGEEIEESISLPLLRKLLNHPHAVVREGALLGISALFYEKILPDDLKEKIEDISKNDPSPTMRSDAKLLLSN